MVPWYPYIFILAQSSIYSVNGDLLRKSKSPLRSLSIKHMTLINLRLSAVRDPPFRIGRENQLHRVKGFPCESHSSEPRTFVQECCANSFLEAFASACGNFGHSMTLWHCAMRGWISGLSGNRIGALPSFAHRYRVMAERSRRGFSHLALAIGFGVSTNRDGRTFVRCSGTLPVKEIVLGLFSV